MKKYFVIGCLIIIAALIINQQRLKNKQEVLGEKTVGQTLKIGAILPLTGGYASVAEEINRGALIALAEAEKQGINLEYIAVDDQFSHTGMINAANKLTRFDKVDIAFVPTVTEVKPIAPIFNQSQIPLLSVWDSNEYIKSAGDYIFSTGFSTEANGQKMAEFAYNSLGLKNIAVVNQIEEWSQLISKSFREHFESLGGKTVIKEEFQMDENDFRTFLAKAKSLNSETLYFPLNPPANSQLLKQVAGLNWRPTALSGDAFTQEEIETAGKAAEGVYFTNIFAENEGELLKTYQQTYGREPYAPPFVSFGYDAIKTIIEADKIAKKENIILTKALSRVKMQGTGTYINMNGGKFSERIEKIYQVKNGKVKLISD